MNDASLIWSGDLLIGASGDLLITMGSDLGQQRVLRRLLTNPGDYIWQPTYGAGLGQFVGQVNAATAVAGAVYGQVYAEASVARQPVPIVTAETGGDGSVIAGIQYVDATTGQSQSLSFSMST